MSLLLSRRNNWKWITVCWSKIWLPGIAARAGVRPGDVILSINNQDVKTVDDFNQLLNKVPKGRNIAILIRRGDTTTFITMKVNGDGK